METTSPLTSQYPQTFPAATPVQPPAGVFIGQADVIRVIAMNSFAALTLELRGCLLDPAGSPVVFTVPFSPTNSRAEVTITFDPGDGYLLYCTVVAVSGAPHRGQCYVRVHVQRGEGTQGTIFATLISDYVTGNYSPGWPHGTLYDPGIGPGLFKAAGGGDPAAGAEALVTVTANSKWQILSFTVTLVTAVAVANRVPTLILDDSSTVFAKIVAPTAIIASKTVILTWMANGVNATGDTTLATYDESVGMGTPITLYSNGRVRTVTESLQGADDYGAPIALVQEWLGA